MNLSIELQGNTVEQAQLIINELSDTPGTFTLSKKSGNPVIQIELSDDTTSEEILHLGVLVGRMSLRLYQELVN